MLKPITDILRTRNLRYQWGYPLALWVFKDGQKHILNDGAPIGPFLKKLQIDNIEIPNWEPTVKTPSSYYTPLDVETWTTPKEQRSRPRRNNSDL